MTEAEAKAWLVDDLGVSRETLERLGRLVDLVKQANDVQNLVAASTLDAMWGRHVADSAQLLQHAPARGTWLDIGSGAGFPGLIIALLTDRPVTLVESRRLRAAFLTDAATQLGLLNVSVYAARIETVTASPFAVISARAVAALDRIFAAAHHLADNNTTWILPKGRSAASELAAAQQTWQGAFVMQPSITDPDAAIITAQRVTPRSVRR